MPALRGGLRAGILAGAALLAGLAACGEQAGAEPGAPAAAAGTPPSAAGQPAASGMDSVDLGVQRVGRSLVPAATGRTVAVLQFPDLENRSTPFGKSIAERLTTVLVQEIGGKGSVLERGQVDQVLQELNLVGEISTRDATAAGQQLGADVVVVGSTTVLDGRVVVNARAVSVADGRVLAADGFTARATPQVDTRQVGPIPVARVSITPLDSMLKLPPSQTAQVGPVQVQAHACARTGKSVSCALTMISVDIDAGVDVSESNSSISDDRGNTVGIEPVQFGRDRQNDQGTLVAGIPTPVVVVTNGIPYSAETISRLGLQVYIRPDGQQQIVEDVVLRSLPILRL
ncbi:MAG: FlgO family outer membrane protein [Gemmatimonadota bacterium]